jgi:hypothetical protein
MGKNETNKNKNDFEQYEVGYLRGDIDSEEQLRPMTSINVVT